MCYDIWLGGGGYPRRIPSAPKFDSAPLGVSDAINIAVYDGDGTVTDIVRVDANGEAEANAPHDIYNIMGQKVRSNALSTEGLKSGIYIINGKKVLVK